MKREAISFLTRELRALGDVEVIDTVVDADYHISVVALETSSRASGAHTGYAVSAIVTAPVNLDTLKLAVCRATRRTKPHASFSQ